MSEDATPLVEALLAIIDAARANLPPDGIGKDAFIARVLEATDNPKIIAALAAHGHRWRGEGAEPASARDRETLRLVVCYFLGRRRSLGEGRARPPCWATAGPAAVAGL
jgi:hypothetical protein